MAASRAATGQCGIALVVVLWTITLLAVIAANLASTMRIESILASSGVERAKAQSLAEAGIAYAVLDLFRPYLLHRFTPDGTPYPWDFDGQKVIISVQDVGGLIDLNGASRELLKGLLVAAGVAQEKQEQLLDAIGDWRDLDDIPLLHGAEDEAYAAAGLPYGAKDAPFESVAELQQVLGMSSALYQRIEKALTVFSGQPGIDPRVAPMQVLRAVPGIDLEAIAAYRAERKKRQASGELPLPPPSLGVGGGYLSQATGLAYSVRAEAKMEGGGSAIIVAVISLNMAGQPPYLVLKWEESL